jgi:cell wall assembly regulator SMI1
MAVPLTFAGYISRLKKLYERTGVSLPLRPPVSLRTIASLEKRRGLRVPAPLRAAWLTANGAGSYKAVFARKGYVDGYDFLSVASAFAEREEMRKLAPNYEGYVEPEKRDARIQPGWFQPGWLPFGEFGGATLLLILDMSPSAKGRVGQIIAYTHDPDRIEHVAPSFAELLRDSLSAIQAAPDEIIGE